MNLRERLTKVAEAALKEGVESSKDIISDNIVPSFEDMGMANVAPGEFAQGEITDKQNLVNKGDMSNDTAFNKEGEHPVEKALDAATDMLDDLVDISAPKANATLEIVKTSGCEDHGEDCDCPECHHKHHHGPFGEAALEEDQPLFMRDPVASNYYKGWYGMLANPEAQVPADVDLDTIEAIPGEGNTPETMTVSDYVCGDINNKADEFRNRPLVFNSLVKQLVADAKAGELVNLNADDAEWLSRLSPADLNPNPETLANTISYYGESIMGKIINKALGGRSCEQYLKDTVPLKESDYAGPRDWNPDARINVSDVLNAIKQEVGDGSEGVHVVKDLDNRKDPIYRVTQIDEEKLPKSLTIETITLKYEDGAYRPEGPSKEAPLTR